MAKGYSLEIDMNACNRVTPRRFSITDFHQNASWILDKLKERYTQLTEYNIVGWLRSLIESREHIFIWTGKALGLATIVHEPLIMVPIVQEVFVFIHPDGEFQDGIPIYLAFKRWADGLSAKEIRVENHTDVPTAYIEAALGRKIERVAYSRVRTYY